MHIAQSLCALRYSRLHVYFLQSIYYVQLLWHFDCKYLDIFTFTFLLLIHSRISYMAHLTWVYLYLKKTHFGLLSWGYYCSMKVLWTGQCVDLSTWRGAGQEGLTHMPPSFILWEKRNMTMVLHRGTPSTTSAMLSKWLSKEYQSESDRKNHFWKRCSAAALKGFTAQEFAGEVSWSSETSWSAWLHLKFLTFQFKWWGPVCRNIYQKPRALVCSSSQLN